MSPIPRFREPFVTLINPLPEVTEQEIVERAGVFRRKVKQGQAFTMSWTYKQNVGSSAVKDHFVFEPGESIEIQKTIGEEIMRGLENDGLVLVRDGQDEILARLSGLQRALALYRGRGSEALRKATIRLNLNEKGLETMKHTLGPYYVNIEKEKAIQAEIDRLQRAPKTASV